MLIPLLLCDLRTNKDRALFMFNSEVTILSTFVRCSNNAFYLKYFHYYILLLSKYISYY